MTTAETWHDALRRAAKLDPEAIARAIAASADTGLRAQRFDSQGGRTSFVACDEPERCDDGPGPHSHMVSSDPTGNAAVRGSHSMPNDLRYLNIAVNAFVDATAVIFDFVVGETPKTWKGAVRLNAVLMPGTVQAGLDVDTERKLPRAIERVEKAVKVVHDAARFHMPRTPSEDEQHWTAGLADEDCCAWHLEIQPRGHYRRPRAGGTNICADCHQVAELVGGKPPSWFMDALIDKDSQPKKYERALSRLADELEVPAHLRSA